MPHPLIILAAQTVVFWLIVVLLHRAKNKITLIPLYSYIAVLSVFTHNFSDLGFAIVIDPWFFLISSIPFFTTLMFGTLYLYLFEGPRAARTALWVILFSSFLYITVVYLMGLESNTANWIQFNYTRVVYYFWSILAIIFDVIFMAIAWELLAKIKSLNLVIRVFFIIFAVFSLDTLIFTAGVFSGEAFYLTMLKGDMLIRLGLSVIGAPIIAYFLKIEGFTEEKRNKPTSVWEILNLHSDLETKITTLEEAIKIHTNLEKQLSEAEETYRLAINGAGAGIWDWDVITNKIIWAPKFCTLLGYAPDKIKGNLDAFKKILNPDDRDRTFSVIDKCFKEKKPYEIEYRLKTKSDGYKWFMASGITKYDAKNKAIRMVGSIIDINNKKKAELALKEKMEELTKINNIMADREVKMVQLKEEIASLKKYNKSKK